MTPDWSRRIGLAKAAIDNGFSRVGPSLRAGVAVDRALLGGAGEVVRLANAVALLCKHHHASECAPLLRSLAGTATAMRWIAVADAAESEAVLASGTPALDWGRMAADADWIERCRRAGLSDAERGRWDRFLAERDRSLAPRAAAGIPWAHIFSDGKNVEAAPEEILRFTVGMMGHALKALDARWPGVFQGSEELECGF